MGLPPTYTVSNFGPLAFGEEQSFLCSQTHTFLLSIIHAKQTNSSLVLFCLLEYMMEIHVKMQWSIWLIMIMCWVRLHIFILYLPSPHYSIHIHIHIPIMCYSISPYIIIIHQPPCHAHYPPWPCTIFNSYIPLSFFPSLFLKKKKKQLLI